MSHPQLVRRIVIFLLLLSLYSSPAAAVQRRAQTRKKVPAEIVLSNSSLWISPGQAVAVRAKVLDAQSAEVPTAKITWNVPAEAKGVLDVRRLVPKGTEVLVVGNPNASSSQTFVVTAQVGKITASLAVSMQATTPAAQIVFDEGKRVSLPVGGKKTVHAFVLDKQGNRVRGAVIRTELLRKADEEFVYVGRDPSDPTVLELIWRPGASERDAPAEIAVEALYDGLREILTIEYKSPAVEDITFDPAKLTVSPGQVVKVKAIVTGKGHADLGVKPSAEIVGPGASKVIKLTGPDKDNNFTLIGLTGESSDPDVVQGVLVVKAGGVTKGLPLTYRRELVSTIWHVMPPSIVGDNFGRTIKNDYYCIELAVRNTSGFDIALAGLAFQPPASLSPRTFSSYSTAHGSLAKRKLTHPRSLTLAVLDGVGSLMTGFNPFFHNPSHAANYSQFIDIVSNPLAKGVATVWRDSYPDELARFEADVLKDDKIIKNESVFKTKVFVPKRVLFPNPKIDRELRDNLQEVERRLGTLVLMGYRLGPYEEIKTSPQR